MTEKTPWWRRLFAKHKPFRPVCPVCGHIQSGDDFERGYQIVREGVICCWCVRRAMLWAAKMSRESNPPSDESMVRDILACLKRIDQDRRLEEEAR